MKQAVITSLIFLIIACSAPRQEEKETQNIKTASGADAAIVIQEQAERDTLKGSLKAYAAANIEGAEIQVNYYSPAVRGRIIWGGLVPYDNVWVTGAHRATNIEFNRDLKIGGSLLPAGKYALFTIPGKDAWTIVINKNWNQHLTDNYDAAEDVFRFPVTPTSTTQPQERLRYAINQGAPGHGELIIQWDQLQISIPFEITK